MTLTAGFPLLFLFFDLSRWARTKSVGLACCTSVHVPRFRSRSVALVAFLEPTLFQLDFHSSFQLPAKEAIYSNRPVAACLRSQSTISLNRLGGKRAERQASTNAISRPTLAAVQTVSSGLSQPYPTSLSGRGGVTQPLPDRAGKPHRDGQIRVGRWLHDSQALGACSAIWRSGGKILCRCHHLLFSFVANAFCSDAIFFSAQGSCQTLDQQYSSRADSRLGCVSPCRICAAAAVVSRPGCPPTFRLWCACSDLFHVALLRPSTAPSRWGWLLLASFRARF